MSDCDMSLEDLEAYLRAKGWTVAEEWSFSRVWQAPSGKSFDVVELPKCLDDSGESMQLAGGLAAIAQIEGRPSPARQLVNEVMRLREEGPSD